MEATQQITIQQTIDNVLAEMAQLKIASDAEMVTAAEWLKRCKETAKLVKDHFEPDRLANYTAYKAVTDTIKAYTDKLDKAERIVKRQLADYQWEQEQKRRDEQRRLEDLARKQEEERRLQQAVETGDETVLDEPMIVPTVHVEPPPKVEGVSYAEHWTFEVKDERLIPREYMTPDLKKLGAMVRATKGAIEIPGVRIYSEKTVRASA